MLFLGALKVTLWDPLVSNIQYLKMNNKWLIKIPEWLCDVTFGISRETRKNTWSWFHMDCVCAQLLKMWIVVPASNLQNEQNGYLPHLNNKKNDRLWSILYWHIRYVVSKVVFGGNR